MYQHNFNINANPYIGFTEAAGIPAASVKRPNHWFSNESTKELIQECLSQTKMKLVQYELKTGTPSVK